MSPTAVRCDNRCVTSSPLAFARRDDRRVLAGVAGGFADQHGIDAIIVRGALVLLSFAGGLGLVLYAVLAIASSAPGTALQLAHPADQRRNLSIACLTGGLLLIVRSTGLWFGDRGMVPLTAMISGVVVLGVMRGDQATNARSLVDVASGRWARARLFAGAGLVAGGLVLVGLNTGVSRSFQVGAFATAVTIVGVSLVLGPWLARVAQTASEERRERIRVQEREAMAAHLHDSVLQTLALIQRSADDPRRTVTIARQQERELREWLYGGADARTAGTSGMLAAAVRTVAGEVESLYHVKVEVVVVGDRPMDEDLAAFLAAVREACVNAAKHSGAEEVAVYVEVLPGESTIEAFVRDRGCGFDRATVPADRRGIARSIEARLARLGGTAVFETAAGVGTEVQLRMPLGEQDGASGTSGAPGVMM